MNSFSCFLCKRKINIILCKQHFVFDHKLSLKKDNTDILLLCVENNCIMSYSSFRAFKNHLDNIHFPKPQNRYNSAPALANRQLPENTIITQDYPENGNNCHTNSIGEFHSETDITLSIKYLICQLRTNTSITESDFQLIIEAYGNMNTQILEHLDIAPETISIIHNITNKTKTFEQQNRFLSSYIPYIKFKTILLGYRRETRTRLGSNILKTIKDTFQYFPIQNTLQALYSNSNYIDLFNNEEIRINRNNSQLISSFRHGTAYKNNKFFEEYPDALRIDLYYDDIELVNPIGAKTGFHKLGMFYFTFQNLPQKFNFNLSNIFTLLICYSADVKKYGFKAILYPFIKEIKILESEDGMNLFPKNMSHIVVRGSLVSLSADTLAAHEIFEMLPPSCNFFCRCCMCTRNELTNRSSRNIVKRTKIQHNIFVRQLEAGEISPAECGVKCDSTLNSLINFHTIDNNVFDIMHDLLEGIVPMCIKWTLNYYITAKTFDIKELNKRINNYRYGAIEYRNKPSPNFTRIMLNKKSNSLRQKAVQNWLLLRALPFLIGHLIENDSEHMRLIIILSKIVQICFSYEISSQMLCELNFLIKNFDKLFQNLFPNINPINKMHHLQHYPEIIKRMGPLVMYCCLKYEANHLKSKKQISASQNFINLPLSLAKRQCFNESMSIANQHYTDLKIQIKSSKFINFNNCLAVDFITELNLMINTNIVEKISKIELNGICFTENFFVVREDDDSIYPLVFQIKEILKIDNKIFMLLQNYEIVVYSEILNAFRIEKTEAHEFTVIKKVSKPYNSWHTYNNPNYTYIATKEYYF